MQCICATLLSVACLALQYIATLSSKRKKKKEKKKEKQKEKKKKEKKKDI